MRGVPLSVAPREVIDRIGESGSGKGAFGRTLLSLVPVHAGQAERRGFSLPDCRTGSRVPCARTSRLVDQDLTASLGPRHGIEDTIGEPGAPSRHLRPKVGDLLESFRLPRDYAA
ncbi:hypothetical protein [Nocardia sp. NPDC049707]|uniref:hypothetical protein n=1 Tax=Nocardia sp. NPDC049707 TaxID=3154735 RepID=UPI00342EECDC